MSDAREQSELMNALVERGSQKIRWAELHMRLLQRLREQFRRQQPFAGLTIGMCLHVEPKTAVLCHVLQAGGANVVITGSPGTTKDDVAAALRSNGITVYGQQDDGSAIHLEHISQVLRHEPDLFLDNGAIWWRSRLLILAKKRCLPALRRQPPEPIACAANYRGRSRFRSLSSMIARSS